MKICLVAPLFDPWLVGGAERYAKTLADELASKHQVIVITTTGPIPRKMGQPKNNLKIIEVNPLNIDTLYDMNKNDLIDVRLSYGLIKKLLWHSLDLWNFSSFIKIQKILEKEKPDLIHTNAVKGFSPSLFSVIKRLRIPHVHTLHDYELISRWSALYRNRKPILEFNFFDSMYISYLRKMSSTVNSVISPSKFTMDVHEKLGYFKNASKYIIPNGITRLGKNTKPKEGAGREFLLIGRTIENKGHQIAIEAFKRVKEKDMKLHIVGTGPYLDTLKLLAKGDERIILHGHVSDEGLNEIFDKSSYAIVPSKWYETFGLVINEAMSNGLPVIASNIGGIPELITDGYNGFLFKPGDADSLHHIIETLANNNEILNKLSNNAIESSKKFLIEDQMKSVMDVYSSTLSKV